MMAKKEQLTMADWMLGIERRLTAIEAIHRAVAIKARELASGLGYPIASIRETRVRLCELADLLDGGSEEGRV